MHVILNFIREWPLQTIKVKKKEVWDRREGGNQWSWVGGESQDGDYKPIGGLEDKNNEPIGRYEDNY
jgi:hypothetical protein